MAVGRGTSPELMTDGTKTLSSGIHESEDPQQDVGRPPTRWSDALDHEVPNSNFVYWRPFYTILFNLRASGTIRSSFLGFMVALLVKVAERVGCVSLKTGLFGEP